MRERGMHACVCGGFEWDNMGPWRGNADSDGITRLQEVLENMREILRHCRWPRHVFTTQWVSTRKLYWQMDSPDIPDAFRHIKVLYRFMLQVKLLKSATVPILFCICIEHIHHCLLPSCKYVLQIIFSFMLPGQLMTFLLHSNNEVRSFCSHNTIASGWGSKIKASIIHMA